MAAVLAVAIGIGPAVAELRPAVAGVLGFQFFRTDGDTFGQAAACVQAGLQGVERREAFGALVVRACRGGRCLMRTV